MKLAYAAVALIALPAPGAAQIVFDDNPPAAAPTKGANAKADDTVVVCKIQQDLGSRLDRHKVCLTKGQWRQYEADDKEKVQRIQESAGTRPSG
jgi:hypothetical protein